MSKIRALILDAGGVLVHPLHGNWNIPVKYRELLGACAADIPGEAWLNACAAEAAILREDIFIRDMEEEYGLRLEFLKRIAARLNWQLSEGTFVELARDFTWNTDRYSWYEDSMVWLPRWSSAMKLAMLSDAMPSFRHVVNHHACHDLFHALVISTEIGAGKPDAKMYLTACERLGVSPEECLFVDDKPGNLQGAMAVGMRAVQMCRDGLAPWQGDFVCNLEELNAYLEELI